MKIYRLYRGTHEELIRTARDLSGICPGCTFDADPDPVRIAEFETETDALHALRKETTDVNVKPAYAQRGHLVTIEEAYVTEEDIECDEDGDEIDVRNIDIVAISPITDTLHMFDAVYSWSEKWNSWDRIEEE